MKERIPRPARSDKRPGGHAGERRPLAAERERLGNRAFGAALQREVSSPGDALEREADRTAEHVVRSPHAALPRDSSIQPPERVVDAPGQPLDHATRAFMEPRFGRDFGNVRVHAGAAAARSAQTAGAKAYTVGDDIVFGAGRYAPASAEGRRLLAHELAHVTQRSGRLQRDELKGAERLPEPPTEETARWIVWGTGRQFYHYNLREEIQWHNNPIHGAWDLVVAIDPDKRDKLGASQIAQISVDTLASGIGVPLKDGGKELVEYITTQVDDGGLLNHDNIYFLLHVPFHVVKRQFDEQAFDAYWADVKERYPEWLDRMFLLVASTDVALGKEDGTGEPDGAKWAKAAKKRLDGLLEEARRQQPAPLDLPDKVVLWERDGRWYLNVWTSLDTGQQEKRVKAIRLEEGEKAEDTLQRVRDATLEALQEGEDEAQAARARELAPQWALDLERKLRKRLDELRAKEGKAKYPDGMVLVPGPDVHLQIWVQRGDRKIQRKTGGVPLVPDATVDQLAAYIRSLTAVLRQYEHTPLDAELAPPEDLEDYNPDIGLDAFPSELYPLDMRGDSISVTGAKNQFSMALDYEAVYGGKGQGGAQDLFIASKLYNQRIHFFWEVRRIPASLPLPPGETQAPESWGRKWQWLYDAFNPIDEQGRRLAMPEPGERISETHGSDSRVRVKLPSEPGDYLVRCYTRSARIGDEKLKRKSSESYFPVRVRAIKDVATEAASVRTGAIAGVEAELAGIEKLLAGGTLKDNERRALLARQKSRTAELGRLRNKEAQTLGQSTAEELAYARQTLKRTQDLKALMPGILERAKKEKLKPSDLITDADLADLYWVLLSGGKSPEAYEKELKGKIEQLEGVEKRTLEFSSELKAGSQYQYNPEAAFVSELTGQVYPLVLMIGEAPKGDFGGSIYSVIDVTSKQTQKVYRGISFNTGPEGHREAIDNAFKEFGEDATYGEGLIAVRIPPGAAGAADPNHPGTGVKTYRSEEGILQKVLYALGIIAAIAGVAALAATGVGAPVAAGILGAVAATAGAITAVHNISERQRRHTLAFDAELVMDIVGIVGVVPAIAGARVAMRTAAGLRTAVVTQRFLQIYSWSETGATVILVPTKLYQDIERIQSDTTLTDDQKSLMIAQARLGAIQSGLMMLGAAAAARAGSHRQKGGDIPDEHDPMLRRQIEALEMEGFGEYQSMQERGWVDAQGNWTDKAPEIVRPKADVEPKAPAVEAEGKKPAVAEEQAAPAPVEDDAPLPSAHEAGPPPPKKEPGRKFRLGTRTIDQNGTLTDEGVAVLREKFPNEFSGMSNQQVKDTYARDYTIDRRGRYHETLIKWEVGETHGQSKNVYVASEDQNFKGIFKQLDARAPGTVKNKAVLDQKAGSFAWKDPVLRKALYALRNHPNKGVREGFKAWYKSFKEGKVGGKKPDTIEFLFDRNLAVISDPTLAVPSEFGPIHEFKTLFYKRVLETTTGLEVGAMDIAPGLINVIGE